MISKHIALTNLHVEGGVVTRDDGRPFDRVGYSRFKYGWLPPATDYAIDMAKRLVPELRHVAKGRPIYVISAPYKFLPTASHAIAQELCTMLNVWSVPSVLLPFHKTQVGDSSYAKASLEERQAQLDTLGLHLDESLVPGSVFIVVDDIRITGTAEKVTANYLEPLKPYATFYVHAARLSQEEAARHPGIEDELNQSVPHDLERFVTEYEDGEFQLNTRVLRFILERPAEALERFVEYAPQALVDQIHEAAAGTGADYCAKYQRSLDALRPLENVS